MVCGIRTKDEVPTQKEPEIGFAVRRLSWQAVFAPAIALGLSFGSWVAVGGQAHRQLPSASGPAVSHESVAAPAEHAATTLSFRQAVLIRRQMAPRTSLEAIRERTLVAEHAAQRRDVRERAGERQKSLPALLNDIGWCESRNEYSVVNSKSGAAGRWQVLPSTWDGYGGYWTASEAPPLVQQRFVLRLYSEAGTSPWSSSMSCWGPMSRRLAAGPTERGE